MSTVANPYASPQTSDLDTGLDHQQVSPKFFAFDGRLGRMRFVTYGFLGAFLLMAIGGIAAAILVPINLTLGLIVNGITVVFSVVFGLSVYIRRLHDLGRSGWWSLLMFVPLLNFILIIYLLFFPGTDGINSFGPRVTRNSTGVIVAFVLSIVLGIAYIGTIFAVAIPAYQEYVERAQQAG
ncbi:DUF805 domain-containing protein [Microbulbifer bruguierae]|uniref:DUF805 domain-containing protein n=1 Tax=Microbulbifer bruguierae TaxID=3029061 RepID=A0ABY8NAM7_9GAMM|nr:DUF805 domain-containing protein [Microbulbifer bruguierae]WGL15469.1 DUF805 domain-containing protein [Microbulbifer bruguierae]